MEAHYSGEVETFILLCGKYIQDDMYKILSESVGFVDDVTKTFKSFSHFTVPVALHLQNANAEFHKVV